MLHRIIFLCLTILAVSVTACKNQGHNNAESNANEYFTCPMHPSVRSKTPGNCPICGMTLVKVTEKTDAHTGHKENIVVIDEHEQKLAGIQTDTIRLISIFSASTILGTVAVDEEEIKMISSRVNGRIETLFIKAAGSYIQKGAALYSIYSEQLLADEKEYISLLNKPEPSPFSAEALNASKNKLLLAGLSDKQIADLEASRAAKPYLTFYSPATGYVEEVKITEGIYVEQGSVLFKITALSSVWVKAQVYSNELANISVNENIAIYPQDRPEEVYSGHVIYSNPVLEETKKVQLLRIKVTNRDNQLKPGMMVYVRPEKSSGKVLAVPRSAVLMERMKTAWIKTDRNTFEQRMIETGRANKEFIEITSGAEEGEIIVVSGAYLINSQFILKKGTGQKHDHLPAM